MIIDKKVNFAHFCSFKGTSNTIFFAFNTSCFQMSEFFDKAFVRYEENTERFYDYFRKFDCRLHFAVVAGHGTFIVIVVNIMTLNNARHVITVIIRYIMISNLR